MITTKELYDKIEIGKSYDFWSFAGFSDLLIIEENDRNANSKKNHAENKGWAWFLYKNDTLAHPLHRKLIILEKGI